MPEGLAIANSRRSENLDEGAIRSRQAATVLPAIGLRWPTSVKPTEPQEWDALSMDGTISP